MRTSTPPPSYQSCVHTQASHVEHPPPPANEQSNLTPSTECASPLTTGLKVTAYLALGACCVGFSTAAGGAFLWEAGKSAVACTVAKYLGSVGGAVTAGSSITTVASGSIHDAVKAPNERRFFG